jgi:hypothetical protein
VTTKKTLLNEKRMELRYRAMAKFHALQEQNIDLFNNIENGMFNPTELKQMILQKQPEEWND